MFLATHESISLAEAGLHGLCASLNTPVVNIEGMPVGPARAAIVVFADDRGGVRLAVGLRSLENGHVIVFAHQSKLDPMADAAVTMDGALSFAEGMGFLFDDDMVATGGPAGPTRALRHWQELVGDLDEADAGGANTAPAAPINDLGGWDGEASGPDDAPDELLLDEFVLEDTPPQDLLAGGDGDVLELDSALPAHEALELGDPDIGPSPARPESADERDPGFETAVQEEEPAVSPRLALSKFRRPATPKAPPSGAAGEDAGKGAALGRIPIVRIRKDVGSTGPSSLQRLLGSF